MIKSMLLFSAVLVVSYSSCKKTDSPIPLPIEIEDEWPDFVDTGANMVAYKVDGKIRVVKNVSKTNPNIGVLSCGYFLNQVPKYFFIIGNRIEDERFDGITIQIQDLIDTGYYNLDYQDAENLASYKIGSNEVTSKPFEQNINDKGFVIITKIDSVNGYITGRFEFDCTYIYGSEKKRITEGRFDVKYYR